MSENSSPAFKIKASLIVANTKTYLIAFFSQVWKRHAPHPWKGNKHCPQTLHCLAQRLDEVRYGSNPDQGNRFSFSHMTLLHHIQCLKYIFTYPLSCPTLVCKRADVTFKWNFHSMFILKPEQGRKSEPYMDGQGDLLNPFLFQKATHSHWTFMKCSYTDLILTFVFTQIVNLLGSKEHLE